MLDFIQQNYQYIISIIIIVIGIFLVGRKRAVKLALEAIDIVKKDVTANIAENSSTYAKDIHDKLPKTAKAFISQDKVQSLIADIVQQAVGVDKAK